MRANPQSHLSSEHSMKIHLVAGARPNYVKIAALVKALAHHKRRHSKSRLLYRLINTGQHYDYLMSKKFFQDLNIPAPYVDLNVGSSSHADQTAKIMTRYEKVVLRDRPDLLIVVGDVNSTLACSLVAAKMRIPVAHVEAGLRSFDLNMPEEINRMVTDRISDYLFTTSRDADRNLKREGVPAGRIFFTGNVMVDTLLASLPQTRQSKVLKQHQIRKPYAVLTLHRPSNVDRDKDFQEILKALAWIQSKLPIIFPVHPRTAARLRKSRLAAGFLSHKNIKMIPPLGYLDFIALMRQARLVLTDSGGIQEETTVLNIPCLTIRNNTERPVTISHGTNRLAGQKSSKIIALARKLLAGNPKGKKRVPPLWDGHAAERIIKVLARIFAF